MIQTSSAASYAYPAGRHSAPSRRAVAQAGFTSARTLDPGLNGARYDRFALRSVILGPGMTVDGLEPWLRRARRVRAWLIVVLHLVAEHNPTGYPYYLGLSQFRRLLDSVQAQPVWLAPQRQVIDHLAQRAVEQTTEREQV
jgi:hypothetical protein